MKLFIAKEKGFKSGRRKITCFKNTEETFYWQFLYFLVKLKRAIVYALERTGEIFLYSTFETISYILRLK